MPARASGHKPCSATPSGTLKSKHIRAPPPGGFLISRCQSASKCFGARSPVHRAGSWRPTSRSRERNYRRQTSLAGSRRLRGRSMPTTNININAPASDTTILLRAGAPKRDRPNVQPVNRYPRHRENMTAGVDHSQGRRRRSCAVFSSVFWSSSWAFWVIYTGTASTTRCSRHRV